MHDVIWRIATHPGHGTYNDEGSNDSSPQPDFNACFQVGEAVFVDDVRCSQFYMDVWEKISYI